MQMRALDQSSQRTVPVEVKITSEDPMRTTTKEVVIAAAKKFKSVTKQSRVYHSATRLELIGEVLLDDLKSAHVLLCGKAGWKGAADPSQTSSEQPGIEVVAQAAETPSADVARTKDGHQTSGELDQSSAHDRLMTAARSERSNGVVLLWRDTQDNGYLSNWAKSAFVLDGVTYNCLEQWIMASKALACHNAAVREHVMQTSNPRKQKGLGRSLDQKTVSRCWKLQQKWDVQFRGARAKFQQNEELAVKLLQTGQKLIAEASPNDKIFGIGLAPNNPLAQDPNNWKGLNLLGKALTQVRDELRRHLLAGNDLASFPVDVLESPTVVETDKHGGLSEAVSSDESVYEHEVLSGESP